MSYDDEDADDVDDDDDDDDDDDCAIMILLLLHVACKQCWHLTEYDCLYRVTNGMHEHIVSFFNRNRVIKFVLFLFIHCMLLFRWIKIIKIS